MGKEEVKVKERGGEGNQLILFYFVFTSVCTYGVVIIHTEYMYNYSVCILRI